MRLVVAGLIFFFSAALCVVYLARAGEGGAGAGGATLAKRRAGGGPTAATGGAGGAPGAGAAPRVSQPRAVASGSCHRDADCVLVPDDCCSCTQGGSARALARSHQAHDERARAKRCAGTMCIEMMSTHPSCAARAVCLAGRCQLGGAGGADGRSGATGPGGVPASPGDSSLPQ